MTTTRRVSANVYDHTPGCVNPLDSPGYNRANTLRYIPLTSTSLLSFLSAVFAHSPLFSVWAPHASIFSAGYTQPSDTQALIFVRPHL